MPDPIEIAAFARALGVSWNDVASALIVAFAVGIAAAIELLRPR